MEQEKSITLKGIWQSKPERYGMLSLVVFAIVIVVAPFSPHSLWPVWIAIVLICSIVFAVCLHIVTKAEGSSHE